MRVENWGLIHYVEALEKQLALVEQVGAGAEEVLVFCTHPPVVTTGRATLPGDVFAWDGEVVDIQRGGRATYHGPNQVIAYPIINLTARGRDLGKYLRALEEVIIETLKEFSLVAGLKEGATGVWIGSQKVASVGIGVKKWISYHGIAVNLYRDPKAFVGLNPCGFTSNVMISVEDILNVKIDRIEFEKCLELKIKANYFFSVVNANFLTPEVRMASTI